MSCKCGHEAADHRYIGAVLEDKLKPRFPCVKCNCKDYDMAPKEAGF